MTKQAKVKEQFLISPRTVAYSKIQLFLVAEGYELIEGKGSHRRIKHPKSGKAFVVPLHDGDCKPIYKEGLKNFYLSTK